MTEQLPLLGFGLPVSGSWATPQNMLHIARRAEVLGYSCLWTFQRTLAPVADDLGLQDPAARSPDDPAYQAVQDAVLPLAYVAAATQSIGLGTATLCAPFTAPAMLAKAMATLDVLSGGRLTVGLGMGWLPAEYAAAGVPWDRRGARFEEYLECLHALWTQDPVEFAGDFYTVPRSRLGVTTVQRPHPPVLLGGSATAALRRAGRVAQGWISSSKVQLATIGSEIEVVRAGASEADRDPSTLRIVVRGLVELDPDGPRALLQGTRQQVLDDLAALRAQGVTEVFLDLNFSRRVGSPDVDASEAVAYAEQVLDAFAPASL